MKNPQGREAKKPKKSKAPKPSPIFKDVDRSAFKVPQSEHDSDHDKS